MRTIGVVTVGRSDYGFYLSVLKKIQADPDLKLHLIVAGMHLLPKYGLTINEIKKEGFVIAETLEIPFDSDTPAAIAKAMGVATQAFSKCYERSRPDILLVLGDRFEMHAAALAALPFKIPVAHIHGGELTLGAIDNALRHSMTILSHLHFPATEIYAKRLLQFGEEPWRVFNVGAPALDSVADLNPLPLKTIANQFNLKLDQPPILVTTHPVTLEFEKTEWQVGQLLQALETFDLPILFTGTNADTGNQIILEKVETFVAKNERANLVTNFGPDYYFSMLAGSRMMVGNSSSGLIEAPSFGLPVVNVGSRQEGRVRAENVIDVGYSKEAIVDGIKKALSPEFKNSLKGMKNPYGDGKTSGKIVASLKKIALDQKLIMKRFVDYAKNGE